MGSPRGFRVGQADSIFLVERGRINLTLPMQREGREEDIVVEKRQLGEAVGWSALVPPHRFALKGAS